MARAYGVLAPVGGYAQRHTIYIGPDGRILYIERDVQARTAGADVAARLEALGVPERP